MDRWDPDPSKGPFRNWLFRIARNMMLNLITRQRRHPRGTGSEEIQWLLEARPCPSPEDSAVFEMEYSANSSDGPPNEFVASFAIPPGPLFGRPVSRAKKLKPSPMRSG